MVKPTPCFSVPYVLGILTVAGRAACTRLARRLGSGVSHDQLTLTLQCCQSKRQTLLLRLAQHLFGNFTDGYLILMREAQRRNITPYQLREDLIFEREKWDIAYVERLLSTA